MASLVSNPDQIRLAVIGMVDSNYHPYSWSAIINGGYDTHAMAETGCQPIIDYLSANYDALGLEGVQVTHVWTDLPEHTERLARACRIAHCVSQPEEVIGQVDAVLLPTDIGHEHVERVRPFIEAGLPILIDKPLVDCEDHLQQFVEWHQDGRPFFSCSALRYCPPYVRLKQQLHEIGELRLIVNTMVLSWERYGIHALEAIYPLLEPGHWLRVTNTGDARANVVHIRHGSGVEVLLPVIQDMFGGFGHVQVYGTSGSLTATFDNNFIAFKTQLQAFVNYLRTSKLPIPFEQTIELMKIIIAGIQSRAQGGRSIELNQISVSK